MVKHVLCFSVLITCLFFKAKAQTDTTYDLGRITVKKNFTQTITIKGRDLERYQFSDLADAINVWLYGTYSNPSALIYVVNGNIINDVNAYSVYDVEEITLVQNALAQVSGASPGQQMVLIKLRTKKSGDHGFEAAGQRSIVNASNLESTPNVKNHTSAYDQYYLSGYKNFTNASFGLSADLQRDVFPELTASDYNHYDPFDFNRIKLNGYGSAKLWKGTTVDLGINYVPQVSNYSYEFTLLQSDGSGSIDNYSSGSHVSQHLFNSNITINSQVTKGLTNTLSGAYVHYNYFEKDSVSYSFVTPGNPAFNEYELGTNDQKTFDILLRDNLIYHGKLGAFDIEPAVNFSYRTYRNSGALKNLIQEGQTTSPPSESFSESSETTWFKRYLLTPSLNLYYKDIFNLQGGFTANLNSDKDFLPAFPIERLSPFLSTSVNVSSLFDSKNVSMRIFGSFARQNPVLDDSYSTLAGFNLGGAPAGINEFNSTNTLQYGLAYFYTGYNPYKSYNNYQAGAVLSFSANFTINYSYENRYYLTPVEISIPNGEGETIELGYYYDKTITNRIGFNYTLNSGKFNWRTGLNFAESKLKLVGNAPLASFDSTYLNTGHRVSGGFTNRFAYKTIFAGFDILYQFGERPFSLANSLPFGPSYMAPNHVNSLSLQNLYAGTQLKIQQVKYAEAFINFRNILQNNSSDITDNRRYYGLGIKVDF